MLIFIAGLHTADELCFSFHCIIRRLIFVVCVGKNYFNIEINGVNKLAIAAIVDVNTKLKLVVSTVGDSHINLIIGINFS